MGNAAAPLGAPRGRAVRALWLAGLVASSAMLACNAAPSSRDCQAAARERPGYVVDSLRPIEVDLERFRAGLGPAPVEFTGGASSRAALIDRFARAVETRDTAALDRMRLSAAEFAWLIYPSSPWARPPYQQAPAIAWMLLRQPSDVGLERLVARRGGEPLRIARHRCDPDPQREGDNRLWRRCVVITGVGADTAVERLFGAIVERHGHFKFASYQNQY